MFIITYKLASNQIIFNYTALMLPIWMIIKIEDLYYVTFNQQYAK